MSMVDRRDSDVGVSHEVLPDGTLHKKIVMTRRQSGEVETIETFEKPPKVDQDMEVIEEVLPDGTKILRRVAMNRVVHSVKTRHESFDETSGRKVEQFEVEEVVPGTASAFDAGVDSDYEEEMERKNTRTLSLEENQAKIQEVLPDGTKVQKMVAMSRVVKTSLTSQDSVDPRKGGSIREDYPSKEVVPGTASAFIAGQDDPE